jgi:hypothetical protein
MRGREAWFPPGFARSHSSISANDGIYKKNSSRLSSGAVFAPATGSRRPANLMNVDSAVEASAPCSSEALHTAGSLLTENRVLLRAMV